MAIVLVTCRFKFRLLEVFQGLSFAAPSAAAANTLKSEDTPIDDHKSIQ